MQWRTEGVLFLGWIDDLALIPKNLDFKAAAATPLAALTAKQALEAGDLNNNETIIIQGASGAVGIFTIQLALLENAKIYATCSEKSKHLIEKYGVEKIIDYKKEMLSDQVREKVDLILNFAPMDQNKYQEFLSLLKPGGRLVSTLGLPETSNEEENKFTLKAISTKRSAAKLNEITKLIEDEKLVPEVTSLWTLDQVKDLYQAYENHDLIGKAVIEIRD